MSANMSIGTSINAGIPDRLPAPDIVQPVRRVKDSVSTDVQTIKEVRNAEMQGRKIAVGEEQLIKAIEKANKALRGKTTTFEFSIHDATKEIMVKVLDQETGEIIREIPPEKVLDMVARLWEMAGVIVDEHR